MPSLEPPGSTQAQQIPHRAGSGHAFVLLALGDVSVAAFGRREICRRVWEPSRGAEPGGLPQWAPPPPPQPAPSAQPTKNCFSQHLFPNAL